jgi:hypothetical protein
MKRFAIITAALGFGFLQSLYAQTPLPSTASFDVGFSRGGTALAVVEKVINAAKSDILMACYEFTSRDIAESLENAAHRGVKVRIVADWKAAHDRFSQTRILEDAGIPVRLDHHYAIHHHKFMVIRRSSSRDWHIFVYGYRSSCRGTCRQISSTFGMSDY